MWGSNVGGGRPFHSPSRGNMVYVINVYAYENTQEQIETCEKRIKQFCRSSTQRYRKQAHVFQKTYTPTDGMEINLENYKTARDHFILRPVACYAGGSRTGLEAAADAAFFSAAAALFANASSSSSAEAIFVFLSVLAFWFRNVFKSFAT